MNDTGNQTLPAEITCKLHKLFLAFCILLFGVSPSSSSSANDFMQPWKDRNQALVLDAYERNPIDWLEVSKNRQIRAFIGKSSDGLPPPYNCPMKDETEKVLCKKTFQNYWLKRELYHTRKTAAKKLGLKWGAYHLGRPGNPIDQANHFINFADPQPDELIALDIEHDDPEKWISFEDAEIFVKHIKHRLGRYPVLYTNHMTARRIAERRDEFPLLSRLPLWYARYKSDINGVFPMGNWQSYALWQFSSHVNCNKHRCPYRVKGTNTDIDVNATGLTVAEFETAWPFEGLEPFAPISNQSEETILVAKRENPEPVTRFKASYSVDVGKRKKVKLKTIAIPTPRERQVALDEIAVASLLIHEEEVLVENTIRSISITEKQLGLGSSAAFLATLAPHKASKIHSSVSYGYTTIEIKNDGLSHHNERYIY